MAAPTPLISATAAKQVTRSIEQLANSAKALLANDLATLIVTNTLAADDDLELGPCTIKVLLESISNMDKTCLDNGEKEKAVAAIFGPDGKSGK